MSTRSIKLFSIPYTVRRPSQCTDNEGVSCCPKCGSRNITFIDEQVQLGFQRNKYFEFNECDDCVHHFVLVLERLSEDYYNVR